MKDEIKFMFENYLNFANCSIQTFDDAKTGNQSLARIMSANNPDTWKQCDDLSSRGAGVFFSVNSMQQGKRGLEYVEEVNSWICEIDGLDKDLQKKLIDFCPLKPSMIIESKSSYHLYWFSIDGKKENWNTVCNGLRNYFDGDKAVVEISRVLRLPGYNHQKNKDDKFMIKVIHHEPKLYKEQEMLEAYPDHRPRTEIKQEATTKETNIKKEIADDNFWERVKNMDSKRVLEVISGDRIVNGDTYSFHKNSGGTDQIFVNGKSTGCWIDTNGKIGSSSGGGPNRTNRVFRYSNIDGKGLYHWIQDNFPEMIQKKKPLQAVVEEKPQINQLKQSGNDEIDFTYITPYTRGLEMPERLGVFDKNDLTILAGYPSVGKTEFTFFLACENAKKGIKCLYITLEMTKQNLFIRLARKKAGISKYKRQKKILSDIQKENMRAEYRRLQTIQGVEFISYDISPTVSDILKTVKNYKNKGFDFVIIDNLGQIKSDDGELEFDTQARATREFRLLVNQIDTSIILLHHLNKPKGIGNYQPGGVGSIRGSQKIIDNATLVFELFRDLDPESTEKNKVDLILYKDTMDGITGVAELRFDKGNYLPYRS